MSTRSYVVNKNSENDFSLIYCHYDGYIDGGVGESLYKNFNTGYDVARLIEGGDVAAITDDGTESLHNSTEKETAPKTFNSREAVINYFKESFCDYLYIFEDNGWTAIEINSLYKETRLSDYFGETEDLDSEDE